MMTNCGMKHPFKRHYGEEQQAEAITLAKVSRSPYRIQIQREPGKWITLGGATTIDALMGIASSCDNSARRVLHFNTVVAEWAAGERASKQ